MTPRADAAARSARTAGLAAVFLLNLRRSTRSRLFLALLLLAAGVIAFVPAGIRGDGTPEGYLLIFVRYALGGCAVLLYLAALWLGCLSIDVEFQRGSSELLFSKPIGRWTVWLGNWFAVALVLSVTTAAAAAAVYGLLRWNISSLPLSPEERALLRERIFVSRKVIEPERTDYRRAARERLKQLGERYWVGTGLARDEAVRMIQYALAAQAASLAPGDSRIWSYRLERAPAAGHAVLLKYRGGGPREPGHRIRIRWSIAADDPTNVVFQTESFLIPGAPSTVRIPADALRGTSSIHVRCTNPRENRRTVLFSPERLPWLEVYVGGFEANYARAVAVLCINLWFLSGLGALAGCVFSLPVAVFSSLWALLMIAAAPYFHSMAGQRFIFYSHHMTKTMPTVWDNLFRAFFAVLDRVFSPLKLSDPLQSVVTGHAIPWSHIGHQLLVKGLLAVLIMSLLGALVLRHRQYTRNP